MTTITIDNKAVVAMLKNAPRQIARANREAVWDLAALAIRRLTAYPPPPAGSTYRRTRTLGRSWQRKVTSKGADSKAVISSSGHIAPYNIYVQDASRQARHMRHWPNTLQAISQEVSKAAGPVFRKRYQEHVGK
jgi:hypothetical protein